MDKFVLKKDKENITIHRFIYEPLKSNMYLILEQNEALVIDPHESLEIGNLLKKNDINKVTILLTHEHYDHISGLLWFKQNFQCEIICQAFCAQSLEKKHNNRPLLSALVLSKEDRKDGGNRAESFLKTHKAFTCKADVVFSDNFSYLWEEHFLLFKHTPGHSKGSCCIALDDIAVFTGDSLIKGEEVIFRFPGGDVNEYKDITKGYLESLKKNTIVLPGHGERFIICE